MSFARWVSERIDRLSPGRIRATIAATTVLVLAGLITHGNYAASGDAVHYLTVAHSVAFDLDFDVANDYAEPGRLLTDSHDRHALPGRNGVLRPVHDVGLPVLAAPFVGLAYRLAPLVDRLPESLRRKTKLSEFIAFRQLISLLMIGVTAVLAVIFFRASWRLTGMKAAAFAWTLIFVLSPPVLTHSYMFLTEIPTALLALLIYLRLDSVKIGAGGHFLRAGLLGILTGLLVLIHVRNIGLVLVFTFLVLWRLHGASRARWAFLSGLAAVFAVKIWLNWLFWGTLLTTPHEHFAGWPGFGPFVTETATRVFGLLLDARHGLLLSAPIYLLAPAGLILLARRSRGAAVELGLIAACYLFFVINPVTNVHGWRGGWSPAARFLVPIAPFVAMSLPLLWHSKLGRIVTSVVVALQVVISAFLWAHPIFTFSDGPGPALWLLKLAGPGVANNLPVWETLTPTLVAVGIVVLLLWSVLTRAIARDAATAEI